MKNSIHVVQAYSLPASQGLFDWGRHKFALKHLLVTAYQWKFVYPEDILDLYASKEVLRCLALLHPIEKYPWDIIHVVSEKRVAFLVGECEYTAARWDAIGGLGEESGIFLDPDILIFPDSLQELDKARKVLIEGTEEFLGGYEQGIFIPDIGDKERTNLNLQLEGMTNMNSGFVVCSGNFAKELSDYIINLQYKSRQGTREDQRMRVLEVIDGSAPKIFAKERGIRYWSIEIPHLIHTTGYSLPGEVASEFNLLGSDFSEEGNRSRAIIMERYFNEILKNPRGVSYDELCELMIKLERKIF